MKIAIERGRVVIDDAMVQRGADALRPEAEHRYTLAGYSTGVIMDSEEADDNRHRAARAVLEAALLATEATSSPTEGGEDAAR